MSRWLGMSEAERAADETAWCAAQGPELSAQTEADRAYAQRIAEREKAERERQPKYANCYWCGAPLVAALPLPKGVPAVCSAPRCRAAEFDLVEP